MNMDTDWINKGEPLTAETFKRAYETLKTAMTETPISKPDVLILPPVLIDTKGAPAKPPGYELKARGQARRRARRHWRESGVAAWLKDRELHFYTLGAALVLTPKQNDLLKEIGRDALLVSMPSQPLPGFEWLQRAAIAEAHLPPGFGVVVSPPVADPLRFFSAGDVPSNYFLTKARG